MIVLKWHSTEERLPKRKQTASGESTHNMFIVKDRTEEEEEKQNGKLEIKWKLRSNLTLTSSLL